MTTFQLVFFRLLIRSLLKPLTLPETGEGNVSASSYPKKPSTGWKCHQTTDRGQGENKLRRLERNMNSVLSSATTFSNKGDLKGNQTPNQLHDDGDL